MKAAKCATSRSRLGDPRVVAWRGPGCRADAQLLMAAARQIAACRAEAAADAAAAAVREAAPAAAPDALAAGGKCRPQDDEEGAEPAAKRQHPGPDAAPPADAATSAAGGRLPAAAASPSAGGSEGRQPLGQVVRQFDRDQATAASQPAGVGTGPQSEASAGPDSGSWADLGPAAPPPEAAGHLQAFEHGTAVTDTPKQQSSGGANGAAADAGVDEQHTSRAACEEELDVRDGKDGGQLRGGGAPGHQRDGWAEGGGGEREAVSAAAEAVCAVLANGLEVQWEQGVLGLTRASPPPPPFAAVYRRAACCCMKLHVCEVVEMTIRFLTGHLLNCTEDNVF